jgi:hypothetical protein
VEQGRKRLLQLVMDLPEIRFDLKEPRRHAVSAWLARAASPLASLQRYFDDPGGRCMMCSSGTRRSPLASIARAETPMRHGCI